MRIIDDTKGPIDPTSLAYRSGMTRRQTFVLPPIPRPQLLTQQLAGCGCSCQMGQYNPAVSLLKHDGMGQYNPTVSLLRHDGMGIISEDSWGLGFVLPDGFDLGADVPSAGTGNTSIINALAVGVNFIPGIGQVASGAILAVNQTISMFESWFGIGAGRREADIIVPVQNNLMTRLGGITDQIRTGQNPDLNKLYSLYREVWMSAVAFVEFVLLKTFTDRRASGQALNTVMPYIDGTCGYAVPVGGMAASTQANCIGWGTGTIGGDGTNGMLGSIGRAIVNAGGSIQQLPSVQTAANQGYHLAETPPPPGGGITFMGLSTPLAVGIGVVALYMFSKRGRLG